MAVVKSIVELSHDYLAQVLKPGDNVIDATAGNGADTIFLASLVGETGMVWAFDVQSCALSYTYNLLAEKGLTKQVKLIGANHRDMREYVDSPVKAVVFNLGYLPGGDHTLTTTAPDTLYALEESMDLLQDGGIIVISVYWGHTQGEEEKNALADFLREPKMKSWQVMEISIPNRAKAPCLIIIEKKEKGTN